MLMFFYQYFCIMNNISFTEYFIFIVSLQTLRNISIAQHYQINFPVFDLMQIHLSKHIFQCLLIGHSLNSNCYFNSIDKAVIEFISSTFYTYMLDVEP